MTGKPRRKEPRSLKSEYGLVGDLDRLPPDQDEDKVAALEAVDEDPSPAEKTTLCAFGKMTLGTFLLSTIFLFALLNPTAIFIAERSSQSPTTSLLASKGSDTSNESSSVPTVSGALVSTNSYWNSLDDSLADYEHLMDDSGLMSSLGGLNDGSTFALAHYYDADSLSKVKAAVTFERLADYEHLMDDSGLMSLTTGAPDSDLGTAIVRGVLDKEATLDLDAKVSLVDEGRGIAISEHEEKETISPTTNGYRDQLIYLPRMIWGLDQSNRNVADREFRPTNASMIRYVRPFDIVANGPIGARRAYSFVDEIEPPPTAENSYHRALSKPYSELGFLWALAIALGGSLLMGLLSLMQIRPKKPDHILA